MGMRCRVYVVLCMLRVTVTHCNTRCSHCSTLQHALQSLQHTATLVRLVHVVGVFHPAHLVLVAHRVRVVRVVHVVHVVRVVRVASWRWSLLHTHCNSVLHTLCNSVLHTQYEAVCCSDWQRKTVHMKQCTLIATGNKTHSARDKSPCFIAQTHMCVMKHVCVCDACALMCTAFLFHVNVQ